MRGYEFQAVSGPGTGVTDSGMITVGTAIAFDTNAYITAVNASTSVTSKNVPTADQTYFMNAEAWGEYKKLRVMSTELRVKSLRS